MTTLVQRDSGYPLMFRLTPGNVNDISTITRSINDLYVHEIKTDFVLMDAGYFTEDNEEAIHNANIEFVTRLPERNRTLYSSILKNAEGRLIKQENLVRYNGRAVYILRSDCKIGSGNHDGFAYLGYDVDRASDICEAQAQANVFYDKFKMSCPLSLKRTTKGLVPQYELPVHAEEEV